MRRTIYINIIRRTLLTLCLMLTATLAWAGDVSTANELKNAFTTGSDVNVYVTSDIVLTETVELAGTRNITLDLKGHTITANDCRAFHVKSGNLVITSSEGAGKVMTIGSIDIESSVIRVGDAGVNVNNASLSINEGVTIESEVCYGVTVFGKNTGDKPESLIVSGAIHTKVRPAISGNGSAGLTSTVITINNKAEITTTNDVAIYHPQNGTLTVNGTVEGAGGIEMKAGELVVGDDATITATGALSHTINNDGTSTRGYAIAIVENGSYAGVSTVNISPSATITGPVAVVKDSEKKPGSPDISFDSSGMQMLVKVTGSDSKDFGQYISLELAMSEAPAGSTITLLGDCTIASTIETTKDFTLNLNSKTITSDGQRALWIKSGTVIINSTVADGKIIVPTISNKDQSVIRVGSSESAAATLTVAEGVTISADECYGITIFGTNSETLTVNGTVNTKIRPAISGNGSAGLASTTITIEQNAQVTTTNEVAIYQPQAGTLTVDGTVTGAGGIEIKGGSLTVGEHANITATGTPSHVANNDGTSTRGYSIAIVENNGGYGNGAGVTAVTIDNAAELTGPVAQLQDSPITDFNPSYTGNAVTNKVAAIGNDEYFTVKDAISIVPSEGSVRLLDALTLTTPLVMDVVKTYTLNLDGKTLTGDGCAALQITNGHVTLDGTADSKVTVSVTAPQTAPQAAILMGSDTGSSRSVSLTINKNVTVDGDNLASGILLAGDVTRETLTVNGTVQATNHSAIIGSKDATKGGTNIHIAAGGKVQSTDAVAIYHPQSGDLLVDGNVKGAGTTAGAIEMKGGDLTITSTATITAVGTTSHTKKNDVPSTNAFAVALVENSAFTGVGKVNIDKTATITGVIACLIDDKNDAVAEPMFTGDVTMVAETNITDGRGDKYDTLPHAIEAAAISGEVKLLDDLTLANTFTISKAITLNMDDYSLINSNASAPAVNINANVTLKNGGVMSEQINDPEEDKANAGINITSGMVTLQQMTVKTGGESLIVNGGSVTIDKASNFTASKDNTVSLNAGVVTSFAGKVYNNSATDGKKTAIVGKSDAALTVQDGVVISSTNGNAIDWSSTGTLTISRGKVMGVEAVNASAGAVAISGGTFTGSTSAFEVANAACTPTVTGGTFISTTGDPIVYTPGEPSVGFVSGVNTFFSKPIDQKLCLSGYMVSQTPKNNGMYYLVDEIVIYDGVDWSQPSQSFHILKAKYIRNSGMGAHGTQYGTLCLPFSFSSTQTGMTFYTVNSIDGNTLYLDAVSSGNIDAGTPVIFKFESATTGFMIQSEDATISNQPAGSGNNLVGTFKEVKYTTELSSKYFLNSDAFHQAKESLTVPAYRAYIQFSSPAKPNVLYIHTDDDEVNSIDAVFENNDVEAIYDLQGRKLNDLQSGMNIMKMADGRTIKVYVK